MTHIQTSYTKMGMLQIVSKPGGLGYMSMLVGDVTLLKFNSSPLKSYRFTQKERSFPTIIFQGRTVKLLECSFFWEASLADFSRFKLLLQLKPSMLYIFPRPIEQARMVGCSTYHSWCNRVTPDVAMENPG